jgi:hypothetical protein
VNLPANKKGQQDTESESKPVKVTIAGPKEGVAKAVKAVQDIVALYYSPVTHPGMIHAEFKVKEGSVLEPVEQADTLRLQSEIGHRHRFFFFSAVFLVVN